MEDAFVSLHTDSSPTPTAGRPSARESEACARSSAERPAWHDPADRLWHQGPDAVSTRDLVALLLPEDAPTPAAERADTLLEDARDLAQLSRTTAAELTANHALGRSAALRLVAAIALGRRVGECRLRRGSILKRSHEIYAHFHPRLQRVPKERFISVLVDGKNRVIRETLVSEGILTASLVHPREVFAPAIRERAGGIILIHNHPSGDPEPSREDIEVTRRLVSVGELVGIRVLDHVVIGEHRYVSFLERGLI